MLDPSGIWAVWVRTYYGSACVPPWSTGTEGETRRHSWGSRGGAPGPRHRLSWSGEALRGRLGQRSSSGCREQGARCGVPRGTRDAESPPSHWGGCTHRPQPCGVHRQARCRLSKLGADMELQTFNFHLKFHFKLHLILSPPCCVSLVPRVDTLPSSSSVGFRRRQTSHGAAGTLGSGSQCPRTAGSLPIVFLGCSDWS